MTFSRDGYYGWKWARADSHSCLLLSEEDGQHLQQLIESYYQEADYANLLLDDVVKDNLNDLMFMFIQLKAIRTFEIG